jgi:SAM-dependent methyltransferase
VACEWVKRGKDRRAFGIDLHEPTLRWGEENNLPTLGRDASRVKLIRGDVMAQYPFRADIVAALNFSYFTFKERAVMLRYVNSVYQSLAEEGIFVLDIFGGPEAQTVEEEEIDHGQFIYIWDQASYNPVTGHIRCHIHFKLKNGKMMRRAFTYDWRLWSIPEMTDILKEVGFKTVDVYWEGTDKDGDGNGVFRQSQKGDDSECWVSYLVAAK